MTVELVIRGSTHTHTHTLVCTHTQAHDHTKIHASTLSHLRAVFTHFVQQVCDMFNYGWIMNIMSNAQTWKAVLQLQEERFTEDSPCSSDGYRNCIRAGSTHNVF